MILLRLFWSFFIAGCFSFGGGYAMLPLINREVVNHGWMTTEEFTNVITVTGMLPGSIGVNAATFVGFQTAGVAGAVVSTMAILLPPLIIVLVIGIFFKNYLGNQWVLQAFYGLKPVIVGLIFYSAIKFGLSQEMMTSVSGESIYFVLICLGSLYLLSMKKIHPMAIICLSGVLGILIFH